MDEAKWDVQGQGQCIYDGTCELCDGALPPLPEEPAPSYMRDILIVAIVVGALAFLTRE